MDYQIQNDQISLLVSSIGAEMQSLKKDGSEYLWNGDGRYWENKSPVLFPFVGRLTEEKYSLNSTQYSMGIHGFARFMDFDVTEQSDDRIVFEIRDTDETYASYPYHFLLRISYELDANSIKVGYYVKNQSDKEMYFGIGGHPGFRVPLDENLAFHDYYLEFSQKTRPDRVGFTQACYLNGINEVFPLKDEKVLPMSHDMFDEDAIVLQNVCREVTLKSDKGQRKVTVSYPNCPYVGFWHAPKTDAPYICIEPWASLPSRQDIIEEFSEKSDMIRLLTGAEYRNDWGIILE